MHKGFQILFREQPELMQAWLGIDKTITAHSALDAKTAELAYLAVLAALGLPQGVAFHADAAKKLGATRAEVMSAVLVGLPAAGNKVIEAIADAVAPFDSDER